MKKISFLIAAHNEAKIISKTLENLMNLPYPNYEVLLGLDGCTDRTEEIVKDFARRSDKIKYYTLNLRKGKPAMISNIIRKATGEIIIIQDADWIFRVLAEEKMKRLISVFDNPEVGGIAEPFPVEWYEGDQSRGDVGYKMVSNSTYYWLEFQKKKFTFRKAGLLYLKTPTMFLTNIFRRELYTDNFSLGDDFERTKHIMERGYKVVIFDDPSLPRMTAVYDSISVKDLMKQKIRTAMARRQLKETSVMSPGLLDYYVPSLWHIWSRGFKRGLFTGLLVSTWIAITVSGEAISLLKKTDTLSGWKLRAERRL